MTSHTSIRILIRVVAPSRGNRVPDPTLDKIAAIFYAFQISNNCDSVPRAGVIVVDNDFLDPKRLRDTGSEVVESEVELINRMVDVVVDLDPDVVVGWEIQNASWGYLNARSLSYGPFITPRNMRVTY
jgi:DNA polymerase zeta